MMPDYSLSINHRRRERKTSPRFFWATIVVIIFLIGVGTGFALRGSGLAWESLGYDQVLQIVRKDAPEDVAKSVDFDLFWNVWDLVEKRYVDQPVNEQNLFYNAIGGIVAGLNDPHSIFLTPEQSTEFVGEINGNFSGIGAEIGIKNELVTIIAPLAGSPAETIGLQSGDVVLAIDDRDTQTMSLTQAVNFIRGESGTTVTLLIRRAESSDSLSFTITRDNIHVESVKGKIVAHAEKKIAFVAISQFNSDTTTLARSIANDLLLEKPDGLVLDLRNNPGGYFDAAIAVSSLFLDEGSTVVIEQASDKTEKEYAAKGDPLLKSLPMVVLINGGSASASEIVAGALRDQHAAIIIGKTSFGKGTVQDLQTFEDGSSLKLTVARWLTPTKQQIDGHGISPAYEIDRTPEDYSADRDPQLDAAFLYLTAQDEFEATHAPFVPTTE